jgi:hypothetical protein
MIYTRYTEKLSLTLSLKRVKLGFEEERTMLKFFIRTGVISGIILGLSVPVGFANSKSGGSKSSYNSKSSSSSKNSYNSKSSSSKSSKNFGGSKHSPPSHHHASYKPSKPHSHKPPKPPKPPKDRSPHDCRNPNPGEQGGRSPCAPHPFGAFLFRLFSHH